MCRWQFLVAQLCCCGCGSGRCAQCHLLSFSVAQSLNKYILMAIRFEIISTSLDIDRACIYIVDSLIRRRYRKRHTHLSISFIGFETIYFYHIMTITNESKMICAVCVCFVCISFVHKRTTQRLLFKRHICHTFNSLFSIEFMAISVWIDWLYCIAPSLISIVLASKYHVFQKCGWCILSRLILKDLGRLGVYLHFFEQSFGFQYRPFILCTHGYLKNRCINHWDLKFAVISRLRKFSLQFDHFWRANHIGNR